MALSIQLVIILGVLFMMMLVSPEINIWKIIIACLLFIPSSVQGIISNTSYGVGGIVNLSTVGYITVLALVVLLLKGRRLQRKVTVHVMLLMAVILMVRILVDGVDFISNKIFDNYFLPMLLAVMMISWVKTEWLPKLLKFMYRIILLGAVIACVEYFYGKSVFYHDYYLKNWLWYENIYRSAQYVAFRSCSIFGHPLIGAIYYMFGIVYLLNDERLKRCRATMVVQFLILVAAIFSTNSRSALLGLGIYIIYFLAKNKKLGKMVLFAIIAIVLLCTVDLSEVYARLFARDSSGSSLMVRVKALASIIDFPVETILLGEGFNNTKTLLSRLGFTGNVEISYLIIFIENGVIGFIAWAASIVYLYNNNMIRRNISDVNVSETVKEMFMAVMVVGGVSNSFGDPGTLNYAIYILLAFSYILARQNTIGIE